MGRRQIRRLVATKSSQQLKLSNSSICHIRSQRICARPLLQRLRREQYGRILRHWRGTNESAGSYPARKRKRGVSVSRRPSQSSGVECVDRVAGPAARIVEIESTVRGTLTPFSLIPKHNRPFFNRLGIPLDTTPATKRKKPIFPHSLVQMYIRRRLQAP